MVQLDGNRMDAERRASIELTEKELAVLDLLAQGLYLKNVGEKLGIPWRTAQHRADRAKDKLGAITQFQAGLLYGNMKKNNV